MRGKQEAYLNPTRPRIADSALRPTGTLCGGGQSVDTRGGRGWSLSQHALGGRREDTLDWPPNPLRGASPIHSHTKNYGQFIQFIHGRKPERPEETREENVPMQLHTESAYSFYLWGDRAVYCTGGGTHLDLVLQALYLHGDRGSVQYSAQACNTREGKLQPWCRRLSSLTTKVHCNTIYYSTILPSSRTVRGVCFAMKGERKESDPPFGLAEEWPTWFPLVPVGPSFPGWP